MIDIYTEIPPTLEGVKSGEGLALIRARAKFYNLHERAKKLGLVGDIKFPQWREKLNESRGQCSYCKRIVGIQELGMDHIIPMSKGGANSIGNVVPACIHCNCSKGNREKPKPKVEAVKKSRVYKLRKPDSPQRAYWRQKQAESRAREKTRIIYSEGG